MRLPDKQMTADDLRKTMFRTFFLLRKGLVLLAAGLPVVLLVYSLVTHGALLERSISAFYGANNYATRDWFVAALWSAGFFLFLYKGFSALENWLLNAAGFFAVATAAVPCNCWTLEQSAAPLDKNPLHLVFAVSFFLCMAAVCFFCAEDTITLLPSKPKQKSFRRRYRLIAGGLLLAPFTAIGVAYLFDFRGPVFLVEALALVVFAAYWHTKSQEFQISSAEEKAADGDVKNEKGHGLKYVKQADQQKLETQQQASA